MMKPIFILNKYKVLSFLQGMEDDGKKKKIPIQWVFKNSKTSFKEIMDSSFETKKKKLFFPEISL